MFSFRSLFTRRRSRPLNAPTPRKRPARQFQLETLEDRITPSTYVVTNSNASGANSLAAEISAAVAANDSAASITFSGVASNSTISLTATNASANTTYGPTAFIITGTGTNTSSNITIDGSGAPGLTIDGGSALRLFAVTGGSSLTLENLTLKDGLAQGGAGGSAGSNGGAGGGGAGLGGAVFVDSSGSFTAMNSTFTANTAQGGAGGSPAAINGGQTGGGGGGGLGGNGNSSSATGGSSGGGANGGTGNGSGQIGTGGNAGFGGGGAGSSEAIITNSGGDGGFGGGGGGGGYSSSTGGVGGFGGGGGGGGGGEFGNGAAGGVSSTLFQNGGGMGIGNGGDGGGGGGGAGLGGAIFSNQGTIVLTNDTFTANSAIGGDGGFGGANLGTQTNAGPGEGGAVFTRNGSLNATFVTFSSNTVTSGAGTTQTATASDVFVASDTSNGGNATSTGTGTATATLVNDILGQATATVPDFAFASDGSINITANNNIVSNNSATGALPGSPIVADPMLGALANNGGDTQTMALQSGSPAIGAGVAVNGITTDQRGVTRPTTPSIGAFDIPPADLAVTSNVGTPATVVAGGQETFTVTVTNNGPSTANNVQISNPIPANTIFESEAQTAGPTFTFASNPAVGTSGDTINGTIASLASGQSATFTFVVQVVNTTPTATTITDTATISSDSSTNDSTPGNNSRAGKAITEAAAGGGSQTFFVVASGANNVTTFSSLENALLDSALKSGDTIQINAGSTPGTIVANDLGGLSVTSLTIQGDPTITPRTSVPTFTLNSDATIAYNLTLQHVNANFTNIDAASTNQGEIGFTAGGTVTDSTINDVSSGNDALFFTAGVANNITNTITNSTLIGTSTANSVVGIIPGTGTGDVNTITGNTFQAAGAAPSLLFYGGGPTSGAETVTDQVSNNQFTAPSGTNIPILFLDQASVSGLTVQGNHFTDADAGTIGLEFNATSLGSGTTEGATVSGNIFAMTGTGAGNTGAAIDIVAGPANTTSTYSLVGNNISTTTGGGAQDASGVAVATGAGALNVMGQGNTILAGQAGLSVKVASTDNLAGADIDFGYGRLGSIGGNNFRGDPTPATSTTGAIVVSGTNTGTTTIEALDNFFTGLPRNAVNVSSSTPTVTVDVTNTEVFSEVPGSGVFMNSSDLTASQNINLHDASILATDSAGDLYAEFPSYGVWKYNAGASPQWIQLNTHDASILVTDLAGDLYAEFPSYGVWKYNAGSSPVWQQLNGHDASILATDPTDDLYGEFPTYGVWHYVASSTPQWTNLTHTDATLLTTDGAGKLDAEFPTNGTLTTNGVWQYNPSGTLVWTQLRTSDASVLAAAPNGDLYGTFAGTGVWRYPATGTPMAWTNINTHDADMLQTDGANDLFASFGSYGLYRFTVGASPQFTQLTTSAVSALAVDASNEVAVEQSSGLSFMTSTSQLQHLSASKGTLVALGIDTPGSV